MMKLIMLPLIFLLALLIIIAAIAMAFVTGQPPPDPGFSVGVNLSDEVLALKPLVFHYARYFSVEDYIWYILAIMQVESGGRGEDVMQRSESLGLPPNSLTKDESIRQGVQHFSQLLGHAERLGADMDTVLQAYRYGVTFIDYVAEHDGQYIAMPFARLVRSHLVGIGSSGFLWPTPRHNLVTSLFGNRRHPITGVNRMHGGIDIAAPFGTPIVAVASGVVTFVGYERSGFGNWIIIDHQNGFQTWYAHNARNLVRVGDRVLQGQQIATVGSTGASTGPHVHFEVWQDGARVDPLQFFPESMFRIR